MHPLKNIPVTTLEEQFARVLQEISGHTFSVEIKDIDFETGETVLMVRVMESAQDLNRLNSPQPVRYKEVWNVYMLKW